MKNKKYIFVLLFSLVLYLVPQGIFWCPFEEDFCLIGVPFYLFKLDIETVCELCGQVHSYSGWDMVMLKIPHMGIISYICAFVTLLLLVESLCCHLRKKQASAVLRNTARVLVCLNIIQFVCAIFYYYSIEALPDATKWMQEIAFIQMIAAIAIQKNFSGRKRREKDCKRRIWSNLLYIVLVCYGFVGKCFVKLNYTYRENADVDYTRYSFSFFETPEWDSGWDGWDRAHWITVEVMAVAFVSVLVAGIIMMFLKEEKRIVCMQVLDKITKIATVLLMVWIMVVCLFSELMMSVVGFLMPDIFVTILISIGCWKLVNTK